MTKKNKETSKEKEVVEEQKNTEETLSQQIETLNEQLATLNDKHLRLTAEFDNYRRRTLKEKMELTQTAGEHILSKILPVIDNFERAISAMETAKDINAVKEGITLIYNNFKEFLRQNGVAEIEVIDQEFDTDTSEAITKIPAPSEDKKGFVIDCTEKGYKLNDKVIRYAKVVVGE
ncbi:MAG: nucleotide exchange factor GrpE [Flavobacteriaceae bacterium]|nr:nucleotide exchange factor GrpE [Flavobacteriaceae bacterium]